MGNRTKKLNLVLAMAAITFVASTSVFSQTTLPPATTFPNEIVSKTNEHLNAARVLAGYDLYPYFAQRCILDQAFPIIDDATQDAGLVTPAKVFDDLYFVGQVGVSAWAVQTSAGLVVFDALNNATEAETILVDGVKRLGFQPTDIRYVVVTHEHRDHFGGARYLQDTYGAQVIASDVAWNAMATMTGAPVRNVTVANGQSFTVGDKTFQFFVTPGHTMGALSTFIPVTDLGVKHMAALYGGFGIPGSVANKMLQINSLRSLKVPAKLAFVDVIIGNHHVQDQSLYKIDLARHRRAEDPNPFVLEAPGVVYQRFLSMQEECIRTLAARVGQRLPDEQY